MARGKGSREEKRNPLRFLSYILVLDLGSLSERKVEGNAIVIQEFVWWGVSD